MRPARCDPQGGGALDPNSTIGATNPRAEKKKRRLPTRPPKAGKELQKQLDAMHKAAQPFLASDNTRGNEARTAYWKNAWELDVVRAAKRVEGNRKEFYGLRLTAI